MNFDHLEKIECNQKLTSETETLSFDAEKQPGFLIFRFKFYFLFFLFTVRYDMLYF